MSITDFKKINNSFLYSNYKKYEYKFGDLDLMSSGGLFGNSIMNFGLFYYTIEDFVKAQDEARFLFNLRQNINFGGKFIGFSPTPEPPIEIEFTALNATNITFEEFAANWSLIGEVADNFKIDVSEQLNFSSFVYEDILAGSGVSYTVTGLTADTTYYYRLRYVKGGITSSDSNIISTQTLTSNFVVPETIIEMFGESWSSTTGMDANYIGPPVVEVKTVQNLGAGVEYNNKRMIYVNEANEYLDLSTTSEFVDVASNYVLFQVALNQVFAGESGLAHYGIDCRKSDSSEIRLRFPSFWTGGTFQHGYMYGVGENVLVLSTLTAAKYDLAIESNNAFIRCLVLQQNSGRLFLRGETTPVVSGGWTPCKLGGTGYWIRVNQNSSNQRAVGLLHLSVHKFPSDRIIDIDWLNSYGNDLATFYNLTWNNFTTL